MHDFEEGLRGRGEDDVRFGLPEAAVFEEEGLGLAGGEAGEEGEARGWERG